MTQDDSKPPKGSSTPRDLGTDALGFRRLVAEGKDGHSVNLLPSFDDVVTGAEASRMARKVALPTPEVAAKRLLAGIPAHALDQPWKASFDDYFRARTAIDEVPTAFAGMLLRPVADLAYDIVDAIPEWIRRPFDRAVGLLLDTLMSLPGQLLGSHLPDFDEPLPAAHDLGLTPYPQGYNSCGETMIATWLKSRGVPIALSEVDTQVPFALGTNLLEDQELRSRGFSLVSGPGTFSDLKSYLAHGHPVMVNVEWASGGGHYAVVTGYDDEARVLTIASYNADGKVARVPYDAFLADWGRRDNVMVVAHPVRDHRLDALRAAGRLSRDAQVSEGLSISDLWVNLRLELFIELAWRYRSRHDDLIVRLSITSTRGAWERVQALGSSVEYTHSFDDDTSITVRASQLPTYGEAVGPGERALLHNVAVYVSGRYKALAMSAGYERGAFQAAVEAELSSKLAALSAEARVSVEADGNVSVFVGAQGRF